MIKLENISFSYPDNTLSLKNINLTINKGEKIVFLGSNGAGKSSLFSLLAGVVRPQKGTYTWDGNKIKTSAKDRKFLASRLGLIFQDPDVQLFAASVLEDICFGPLNMKKSKDEALAIAADVMNRLHIEGISAKAPHQLSYGQRKQVALAGIMAMDPDVYIFDEPFAWLDQLHVNKTKDILSELSSNNKTILLATHDTDFAWEWADKLIVLDKGEILREGAAKEILQDHELLKRVNLDLPHVVRLAAKLNLDKIPTSMDDLYLQLG